MDRFRPAAGLHNPHLQTIWQALFRREKPVAVKHEVWDTPDGDVVDIDFLPKVAGAPGVILLHGLEGCSKSPYILGMLRALRDAGWNAAAVNHRTCGPTPARGHTAYHSGFTQDLDFVARELQSRWSGVGVMGFSLGANVALKWAGTTDELPADAVVAVSCPYDLALCATNLDGPGFWNRVYLTRFLRSLKDKARRAADEAPHLVQWDAVKNVTSIRDYDHEVTARLHGFESAEDYYAKCSSNQFLEKIERPTMLVSATDDPMIPEAAIPDVRNPKVRLVATAHGGHVGFVSGHPLRAHYPLEHAALSFFCETMA